MKVSICISSLENVEVYKADFKTIDELLQKYERLEKAVSHLTRDYFVTVKGEGCTVTNHKTGKEPEDGFEAKQLGYSVGFFPTLRDAMTAMAPLINRTQSVAVAN